MMWRKLTRSRRSGGILLIALGGAVGLVAVAVVLLGNFRDGTSANDEAVRRFASAIPSYVEMASLEPEFATAVYVRGKVVPVDVGRARLATRVYEQLSAALRPERPEDVSTVLLIDWDRRTIGLAHVSLVDATARQLVVRAAFDAGDARDGAESELDREARVVAKIARWLEGLPRA
jgi:hypothetical protein